MSKLPSMVIEDGPEFGDVLRELRRERGLSLQDLASRLGLGGTYLSEVERGVKPLATQHLYRAATVLKVPRATLQGAAARATLKAKGLWAAG